MYGIYEQMTTLQYRYHCLLQQLEAFKSGEKYRSQVMDDLEKEHRKEVERLLAEIRYLKKENRNRQSLCEAGKI